MAQGGHSLLTAPLHSALTPHVPPRILPENGADHLDDVDLALWHTEEDTAEAQ